MAGERIVQRLSREAILGNQVPIANDELVDYIIGGIPDEQLQNQARMQSFASMQSLLTGFSKIQLTQGRSGYRRDLSLSSKENKFRGKIESQPEIKPSGSSSKEMGGTSKPTARGVVKYFACGESRYISKECKQPNSVCSGCGKTGHTTKNCTALVEQINFVDGKFDSEETADFTEEGIKEDDLMAGDVYFITETEPCNEFVKIVFYNIRGREEMGEFSLMTQIDTRCRISLIKARYVKQSEIQEKQTTRTEN